MMSEFDKEHLREILQGHGTYFNAKLLRLISQSDRENMELMHKVYPEQVEAVYKYQNGKDWDERTP